MISEGIDYSRIGKRARRKGKNFELEVREMISKYLDIPKEFIDHPMDFGGQPVGDLIIVARYFNRIPVLIEIKKREQFHLHQIFTNPDNNPLVRWWKSANEKIPESDRDNLILVFSKNYFPIFCLMPVEVLEDVVGDMENKIVFESKLLNKKFVVVLFKDFLLKRRQKLGLD